MTSMQWLWMDLAMAAGIFVGNFFFCMQPTVKDRLIVGALAAVIFFVLRWACRVFTGY